MMQKGRMLALLTAASLAMGALGVQAWAGKDSAAANMPILLRSGALYMTRDTKTLTTTAQPDSAGRHLYIVQFTGPVQEAYKSALVRLGAEVGDYLPDYAFLIRMEPATRQKVEALGFVKGVAPYGPSFKLDQSLTRLSTGQQVPVRITTFGTSAKGPVNTLSALGIRPDAIGQGVLVARVDSQRLKALADSTDVVFVEPVLQNQLLDDKALPVMGVSPVVKSGYDGKGQIVAVTDTGLDTGKNDKSMHPDFQGQIKSIFALGKTGDASDTLAHGTHVAGSVLGTGAASSGQFKGAAPGASLVFQAVEDSNGGLGGIPGDLNELFRQAYGAGARIHTNSWGVPATSGGTVYDAQSAAVDRFMWENPDYTILFAAGNDGDHDRDNKVNYNTVSTPGTAKNAITVGASQNDRPEKKMATNINDIALFSSRGPTADGRVKPDVVAPGTWIVAPRSSLAQDKHFWGNHESNSKYGYMGGTSMATPLTAGSTAVLRQFYVDKLGVTPRASLLKATLINGATAMDSSLTWRDNGWGRVDLNNAIAARPFKFINEEKALKTGEAQSYTYTVKSGQPLKVTLVWTDYPANPSAQKTLVNDLDLLVKGPDGAQILGNHMLGKDADRINNVENVVISAPKDGTYTVTVTGQNVPQGPQRFAMVLSGNVDGGTAQPTPPEKDPQEPAPQPPKQDKEAPKAAISAPAAGATLSGQVTITAEASDNVGVTKVIYYVDGKELATATAAPFAGTWDTTKLSDGTYTLVANAYDAAKNVGISKAVTVNVRNAGITGRHEIQYTGKTGVYGTTARYFIDVKAPGTIKAELGLKSWANVALALIDPAGRAVVTGKEALSFQATTPGTYSLVLTSMGGWSDYALKVAYPPADGTAVTSKSGALAANQQRFEVHTITLSRGGSLNAVANFSDPRADIDLYLLDGWGRILAQATSPNLNPENLSAVLPAGTYYLYVVADSGKSDYQLSVIHPR